MTFTWIYLTRALHDSIRERIKQIRRVSHAATVERFLRAIIRDGPVDFYAAATTDAFTRNGRTRLHIISDSHVPANRFSAARRRRRGFRRINEANGERGGEEGSGGGSIVVRDFT